MSVRVSQVRPLPSLRSVGVTTCTRNYQWPGANDSGTGQCRSQKAETRMQNVRGLHFWYLSLRGRRLAPGRLVSPGRIVTDAWSPIPGPGNTESCNGFGNRDRSCGTRSGTQIGSSAGSALCPAKYPSLFVRKLRPMCIQLRIRLRGQVRR